MDVALAAARAGAAAGEVPVGAALAIAGEVVAVEHNAPIKRNDPTAHAEVLVLRRGGERIGNYRLTGATLYVTMEPCAMCVGACLQARVARLVYGCRDPKAGALGSIYDLGRDGLTNHRLEVTGGVGEHEARELLQIFFRVRRGA